MSGKIKNYFNQTGAVAQLPLVIGLLLIGVALPAGLRLVQQQQEIRREAAGDYQVVGRVHKDGSVQNWSVYQNKIKVNIGSVSRLDDTGFKAGRFNANATVVISLDTSGWADGYSCTWRHTDKSGQLLKPGNSCRAEITIKSGDRDWENHLNWHLHPEPDVVSPTCRFATSVPQTVQVGESATFTVSASGGSNNLTQIQLHKRVDHQWVAIGRCDNTGTCTKTTTFSKPGEYWVVCNAFNDYQPTSTKYSQCSGNPFGSFDDWADCGNDSRKRITVVEGLVPTPTPTATPPLGPTPTPTTQPGVPTSTPTPTLHLPPPPPLKSEVIFPCNEFCRHDQYNPDLVNCGAGKVCYTYQCRNVNCKTRADCICPDQEEPLPTPNACRCLTRVDNWCLYETYYGDDCPCTDECPQQSFITWEIPEVPDIKDIVRDGLVVIPIRFPFRGQDPYSYKYYIDLFHNRPLTTARGPQPIPGTNQTPPCCQQSVLIPLERNKYCNTRHTCFDTKTEFIEHELSRGSTHLSLDILRHDKYPENARDLQNMISSQDVNNSISRFTPVRFSGPYYHYSGRVCGKVYNNLGEDITMACTWGLLHRYGHGGSIGYQPLKVTFGHGFHWGPDGSKCMNLQYFETFFHVFCAGGDIKSPFIPARDRPDPTPAREPTSTPRHDPLLFPTPTVEPSTGCPRKSEGDANCDGKINVFDFSIWRQEKYDRGADTIQGDWQADFNGDGYVDEEDLKILLENWDR